jgi:tetratricopeptide (TPR) repeat protein
LQKRLYIELEAFLKQSYKDCIDSNVFTKKTHEVKLQILTYLTNCLFKNKKYEESISNTLELRKAIDEHDGLLYNKYNFYYYNGLVINYSSTDKEKAIEVLLQAKNDDAIKAFDYHYFFVCSNLALQYFDQKKYKPAIKNLSRIIQHKNFLNFDLSFQIKIIAAELIIRYEIGDFDMLEMRIKSIKNRFKTLLSKDSFSREKILIKIISKLIYVQRIDLNENLQNDINLLLSIMPVEEADESDIINYNRWLSENILAN